MVKNYKWAGRSYMNYDMSVDDLADVIYNTKERKVWTVFRPNFFANLKCITDYLNEFGIRGGFEKILHFMSVIDEKRKLSLKHIQYLIDFLSKSQPLWHRQFSCYFIPKLRVIFEKILLYTNPLN